MIQKASELTKYDHQMAFRIVVVVDYKYIFRLR